MTMASLVHMVGGILSLLVGPMLLGVAHIAIVTINAVPEPTGVCMVIIACALVCGLIGGYVMFCGLSLFLGGD